MLADQDGLVSSSGYCFTKKIDIEIVKRVWALEYGLPRLDDCD